MPNPQTLTQDSLFKRRHIRDSKACATTTAYLLRRVIEAVKVTDVAKIIETVQQVGQRLIAAQPRELAIGNLVRRVLGVIREESEENQDRQANAYSEVNSESRPKTPRENVPQSPDSFSSRTVATYPLKQGATDRVNGGFGEQAPRPPLLTSHTSYTTTSAAPIETSMFSLLSYPDSIMNRPPATPGTQFPRGFPQTPTTISAFKDFKAEVLEGIQEILEELNQADDQIAGYALEHVHSNEVILIVSFSITVQKFLLKAATKRRFTVIYAEGYPNDHEATHASVVDQEKVGIDQKSGIEALTKALTAAGITVILIPDSAVFALMSQVNKVIIGARAVLANGCVVAAAGSRAIATAAHKHSSPVVVLCAIYQLSSLYPLDPDVIMENEDPSKIISFDDGDLLDKIDVNNPMLDYIPAELVDLYVTNL